MDVAKRIKKKGWTRFLLRTIETRVLSHTSSSVSHLMCADMSQSSLQQPKHCQYPAFFGLHTNEGANRRCAVYNIFCMARRVFPSDRAPHTNFFDKLSMSAHIATPSLASLNCVARLGPRGLRARAGDGPSLEDEKNVKAIGMTHPCIGCVRHITIKAVFEQHCPQSLLFKPECSMVLYEWPLRAQ